MDILQAIRERNHGNRLAEFFDLVVAAALIEAGYCTDPRDAEPVNVKPELIGTFCECGASYDETRGGYRCAR